MKNSCLRCIKNLKGLILSKRRDSNGFTLIELLVAISIIGILTALGISSFIGARRGARDARRLGDAKFIIGALEQYFQDNGTYIQTSGWACSPSNGGKSDWIPGLSAYISSSANQVPNQFGGLQGHCYTSVSTGYYFHYTIERPTTNALGTQFDGPGINNATYPRYEIRGAN